MPNKYLVVYYSRSGATKIAAETIASKIGADIDEITSRKYDAGIMGIITAGIDVFMKSKAEIESSIDPGNYEHVIIGTPVWGFIAANPVITYLENNKGKFKAVSFFSCSLLAGGMYAFDAMTKASDMHPVATLDLGDTEVRQGNYDVKLNKFIMMLRGCANISAPMN